MISYIYHQNINYNSYKNNTHSYIKHINYKQSYKYIYYRYSYIYNYYLKKIAYQKDTGILTKTSIRNLFYSTKEADITKAKTKILTDYNNLDIYIDAENIYKNKLIIDLNDMTAPLPGYESSGDPNYPKKDLEHLRDIIDSSKKTRDIDKKNMLAAIDYTIEQRQNNIDVHLYTMEITVGITNSVDAIENSEIIKLLVLQHPDHRFIIVGEYRGR